MEFVESLKKAQNNRQATDKQQSKAKTKQGETEKAAHN